MKKLWRRVGIPALALIIVGAVLAGIGYASGAHGVIYWQNGSFRVVDTPATEKSYDLQAFTDIDISTASSDIELIPSDHYGIDLRYSGDEPEWSVKNGVLRINDKSHNFGFTLNLDFTNYGNFVKVYYPRGTVFGTVKVGGASSDVKLTDVSARELTVKVVSGDVTLQSITAATLSAHTTSGEVTLDGVTADAATLGTVSGGIKTANMALGTLTAKTTSGDIRFSGSLSGAADISAVSGDVRFVCATTGHGYDISTTSGGVRVNGQSQGHKTSAAGTLGTVKIRTTSGDVTYEG
ncbi:MAG: DUF4097 domain-containing protein [Oscillospiraceae bacterium]|jgi:hypothetical protein|nr:DUF4097 domain-containing protein [Oscillospiraceae bacterium]